MACERVKKAKLKKLIDSYSPNSCFVRQLCVHGKNFKSTKGGKEFVEAQPRVILVSLILLF